MRNLPYELDLFYRIQAGKVNGVPLIDLVLFGDAPLWHRFHQVVFDADIRRFSATRSFSKSIAKEKSFKKPFNVFFASLFAISSSLLVLIVALVVRPRVFLLSVDKVSDLKQKCDFRLSAVYEFLKKNNISFVEFFHTTLGRSLYKNFFTRVRFGVYLEAFDELWYFYRSLFKKEETYRIENISGTEDEILFIEFVITKYLRTRGLLEFRTRLLTFFLKITGIKLVLGIDDVRHYHELLEATRRVGIKSVVVQHGHFTKYHVGWLQYKNHTKLQYQHADTLLVWSEYWKHELFRLNSVYSEKTIEVSGYSGSLESHFAPSVDSIIVVLIPHETDSPKGEVSAYIRTLIQDANIRVYLKVRPDIDSKAQMDEYDEDVRKAVVVVKSVAEVPKPTVALGVYSTFLYDMALLGIPVCVMETSMDYGEGMIQNGIAEPISLNDVSFKMGQYKVNEKRNTQAIVERLGSPINFQEKLTEICKRCGVL